jgi:hypothetical protein
VVLNHHHRKKSTPPKFFTSVKNTGTGPIWLNICVMKKCKTCNQSKPLTEYYAHRKDCKTCISLQYHATKEPLKGYPTYTPKPLPIDRTCRVCDQTKLISEFYVSKPAEGRLSPKIETRCKSCTRDHYNINKESILAKAATKRVPKTKSPRKTVEETRARQTAYTRARRQTNSLAKLRANIGSLIANSLANQGYKKTSKSASILGCSFEHFYHHVESQFTASMSWDNRDQWHVDHIIPVSFAQTEQELLLLNHYSNLRPLWSKLNQTKAGNLTDDSINHPLYKTIIENRITG